MTEQQIMDKMLRDSRMINATPMNYLNLLSSYNKAVAQKAERFFWTPPDNSDTKMQLLTTYAKHLLDFMGKYLGVTK